MITRNSAKCVHCGTEIVSTHRHHFAVHYCQVSPKTSLDWVDGKLVPSDPPRITWNFAVDGGKDYLKRCGEGFVDTSTDDTEGKAT